MPDEFPLLRACLRETRAVRTAARSRVPGQRRSAAMMASGAVLVAVALPGTLHGLLAAPAAAGPPARLPVAEAGATGAESLETVGDEDLLRPVVAERGTSAVPARPLTVALSTPVRVSVPQVGLRADVVSNGRRSDGSMREPRRPEHAAWYRRGPVPGQLGAALIIGHVDSPDKDARHGCSRAGGRLDCGHDNVIVHSAIGQA